MMKQHFFGLKNIFLGTLALSSLAFFAPSLYSDQIYSGWQYGWYDSAQGHPGTRYETPARTAVYAADTFQKYPFYSPTPNGGIIFNGGPVRGNFQGTWGAPVYQGHRPLWNQQPMQGRGHGRGHRRGR